MLSSGFVSRPSPTNPQTSRGLWLTLGVLLVVAGFHLWLIARYASDQPFSDQWGAEGHIVFEQWLHHRTTHADYLATHAEHRPVLTCLLTFATFLANRQWDCRVETLAGASQFLEGSKGRA